MRNYTSSEQKNKGQPCGCPLQMKVIDLEQLVVLSAEAWDADACSVAVLNDYLENLELRSRIAQHYIFLHNFLKI